MRAGAAAPRNEGRRSDVRVLPRPCVPRGDRDTWKRVVAEGIAADELLVAVGAARRGNSEENTARGVYHAGARRKCDRGRTRQPRPRRPLLESTRELAAPASTRRLWVQRASQGFEGPSRFRPTKRASWAAVVPGVTASSSLNLNSAQTGCGRIVRFARRSCAIITACRRRLFAQPRAFIDPPAA